ncbi:MAG: DUF3006 domain-containing protein [Proteocatella sp.]
MRGIIDRFEGDYAVVEIDESSSNNKKRFIDIPKSKLPKDAEQGDCVIIGVDITVDENITIDENIAITIDKEETLKRKVKIEGLFEELFEE